MTLSSGEIVTVTQKSNGPWLGGSTFIIESKAGLGKVKLCLRIPVGSNGFRVCKIIYRLESG